MVMVCTLYVHRSEWDTFAIRTLDHGLLDRWTDILFQVICQKIGYVSATQ